MNKHPPIELQASIDDLLLLAKDIKGFSFRPDSDHPYAMTIEGAGWAISVRAADFSLADKFEVFTLGVERHPVAPSPLAEARAWPFQAWEASVLIRRDWLAEPDLVPDFQPGTFPWKLEPDEVPPGTVHACRVAVGLLFAGDSGRLLVAASPDVPMTLLVSEDEERIQSFTADCRPMSLQAYVARLAR